MNDVWYTTFRGAMAQQLGLGSSWPLIRDGAANLFTKILDFGGFDSSRVFILGVEFSLMSKGIFPTILSQQILVGRLGVSRRVLPGQRAAGGWTRGLTPRYFFFLIIIVIIIIIIIIIIITIDNFRITTIINLYI